MIIYHAREIYAVNLFLVNQAGAYAVPDGYPKYVDSRNYNNDVETARRKAYGYLGAAENWMSTRDDQIMYAYITRCSDGKQLEVRKFGKLKDIEEEVPDPEPEPEPEPETPDEGT